MVAVVVAEQAVDRTVVQAVVAVAAMLITAVAKEFILAAPTLTVPDKATMVEPVQHLHAVVAVVVPMHWAEHKMVVQVSAAASQAQQ
jgi:hypothetical protein